MNEENKTTEIPEELSTRPLTSEVFEQVDFSKVDIPIISTGPKKRGRKPGTKNTQTITIEATEIVPLNDVIVQELTEHNITESALDAMERDFLPLTINGIDDKIGYESVNKARIMCKTTRILTTKLCKEGRDEAIKIQKAWISKEKEIVDRIEKVESALAEKQAVIDQEKEKIKAERDAKEQIILNERAVKLISLGMIFDTDSYVLDEIKISVTAIKNYDTFTWNTLLAGVETKFKAKEEARLEQERLNELATAEIKRIAEENLAKQEALRKQEEALLTRQKAIEQAEVMQKAEAERLIQKREATEKAKIVVEEETTRKLIEDAVKIRKSSLFVLGFAQNENNLTFKDLQIKIQDISNLTEQEWNVLLTKTTQNIQALKEHLEKERIIELERIKEEAATRERSRIEKEIAEKLKQENETKEKLERERLMAEAETKRLAELRPDLDKLNLYLKTINDITVPEFSTKSFQDYTVTIITTKNQFLSHIFKSKPL